MSDANRDDDEFDDTIDDLIADVEADLRRRSAPTTARILAGLDTVLWQIARMEEALRLASPGVVTDADAKAFRKAFGRMQREGEALVSWLRFCVLETPRN